MIIAVDFDGTIVQHDFPNIGKPIPNAIETLINLRKCGHKLILWSCRENNQHGTWLDEAIEYCKSKGLEFDAVNDNLQPYGSYLYTNCRKIYADLYIDDKAIKCGAEFWQSLDLVKMLK